MLGKSDMVTTIGVKDLGGARRFYEGVLELKFLEEQDQDHLLFQSGNSKVIIYRSGFAGTNQATTATFFVGKDVDSIISGLKAKGVTFEHYDIPGATLNGDVYTMGDLRTAWFKDPDGNILNVVSE